MRRKNGTRLLLTVDAELLEKVHRFATAQGLQVNDVASDAFKLFLWAKEAARHSGAPADCLKVRGFDQG